MKSPLFFRALQGFGLVFVVATSASASPEYPGLLREQANIPCVPPCTVCHTTNPGHSGTAQQKFAIEMIKAGLLPGSPNTLPEAVNKMKANAATAPLIEALSKGLDPNYDTALGQGVCGPSYGCGARVAKAPPKDLGGLGWIIGALAAVIIGRKLKR